MFASECRTKEIELSLFLGASLDRLGTPPRIKADPTRLGQIIINLLANAIRFTAPSLGPKQISVKVEVATREPEMGGPIVPPVDAVDNDDGTELFLYFEVEDSGPGMSAEESGRIFGKFVQASPLTHCVFSGNGLGLFICRSTLRSLSLCSLSLLTLRRDRSLGTARRTNRSDVGIRRWFDLPRLHLLWFRRPFSLLSRSFTLYPLRTTRRPFPQPSTRFSRQRFHQSYNALYHSSHSSTSTSTTSARTRSRR